MRVVGGLLQKGVVAHRGGKEAVSWLTVRSPPQQLQALILHTYQRHPAMNQEPWYSNLLKL